MKYAFARAFSVALALAMAGGFLVGLVPSTGLGQEVDRVLLSDLESYGTQSVETFELIPGMNKVVYSQKRLPGREGWDALTVSLETGEITNLTEYEENPPGPWGLTPIGSTGYVFVQQGRY